MCDYSVRSQQATLVHKRRDLNTEDREDKTPELDSFPNILNLFPQIKCMK